MAQSVRRLLLVYNFRCKAFKACLALSDTFASCYIQEVHLHGNDMGNEGIRELMVGLMAHKGMTHAYLP